jgi:hypothetical protein
MLRAREDANARDQPPSGLIQLAPEGSVVVECELPANAKLSPGKYTIAAAWTARADKSLIDTGWHSTYRPRYVAEFEFRQVTSEDDRLDQLLHFARRAWSIRDRAEALTFIETLLSMRPNSVEALLFRARLAAEAGDCRAASLQFERVAAVIEQGLDRSPQRSRPRSIDEPEYTAETARTEAQRWGCH